MSIFALKPMKGGGSPKGFSLVITISLMVLLSLLAVGMLTLATISLRASRNSDAMAVARANARLALELALGDLQKWAGKDQRVTATANIAGTATGDELPATTAPANAQGLDNVSRGLSQLQPGTRHWTGVFRNNDAPNLIYTKTPTAVLERWLVSSRDGSGTNPADASCAVGANGEVANTSTAVVLAGNGSVGSGTSAVQNHVAVPKVDIEANNGLPGGLAWWISDEGVKSRLNIERSSEQPGEFAALVPQRRGWETVSGFSSYPSAVGDADRELPRIVSSATTGLVLPDLNSGDPSALQASFHAATTHSLGLITNALEGGFRVDLTPMVESGLDSQAPPGSYDNHPVQGGRIIPTDAARTLTHSRWDQLSEFISDSRAGEPKLEVTGLSSGKVLAVAPTVIDFRLLLGVKLVNPTPSNTSPSSFRLHPCGKVAITIANPYSKPLEWTDPLEFEIRNTTPPGNRPSRIWQFNETCAYLPRDGTANNPGGESAVFNQAVFTIARGQLQPGEARAYTIGSPVVRPAGLGNRRVEVPLLPTDSAAVFDFNRCVELQTNTVATAPFSLDVREDWQTSRILLEMRIARQSGWLRRIEGFELDNGYFTPNTRTFSAADAPKFTAPVPLMLYSFQISQPGMNYLSLMPTGYELGQRASTIRTFTDFNLRARNFSKAIASYNPPPFFMESNDSISLLPFRQPGGETGTGFTRNLAFNPVNWGYSSVTGANRVVLYSFPRDFVSLAQFQHADLTADDTGPSIGHQPANAFGNSYANPFVRRATTSQSRFDYVLIGLPAQSGAQQIRRNYYDISYLLNASIWDRYFLSTIASDGRPRNPAIVTIPGTAPQADSTKAAGSLMIDGAFNINSTDPRAWKALLASSRHFTHPAGGPSGEAAFPRSMEQPTAATIPPTGTDNDSYSGYRRLSETELENLAQAIVRQVRRRGPFVSLSHFVNRALVDISSARDTPATREISRSGALQYALDDAGINFSPGTSRSPFSGLTARNDQVTLAQSGNAPRADLEGGRTDYRPTDADPRNPDWANTSRDANYGAVASILADRTMLTNPRVRPEQGFRSSGIPAWVTQADVLQAIGPVIAPRSDTFVIRTCGEARDDSGRVLARAYCEAVVQRLPEYVDPANAPDARGAALSPVNRIFGRRFSITSFRWLSPDEI